MEHRTTADLCDHYGDAVQTAEDVLRHFAGRRRFGGQIVTVKVHEDNLLVRAALDERGQGRVLVVDGGGSRRCALFGDLMASRAIEGDWAGVVVHGCVRDTSALAAMDIGVLALGTSPRRSEGRGGGQRDVPVTFAGVRFEPGAYLFADGDGLVVLESPPVDRH